MSDFLTEFANAIRVKRTELGLSQRDLAKKLDTRQRAISGYENGVLPKDNTVIDKLADVLGVNLIVTSNDSLDELLSAAGYEIMWSNDQIIATKGGKSWLYSPIKKPQV